MKIALQNVNVNHRGFPSQCDELLFFFSHSINVVGLNSAKKIHRSSESHNISPICFGNDQQISNTKMNKTSF